MVQAESAEFHFCCKLETIIVLEMVRKTRPRLQLTLKFFLQIRQSTNAADEAEADVVNPIYANPIDQRIPVSFPWENTDKGLSPNQVCSIAV